MTAYEILPYMAQMQGEITEIERASFSCPWSADSFRQAGEMENSIFLVLREDGNTAGFGIILTVAGEGELVDIAVAPAYRKKGYGQALMTALLSEAQAQGIETLYLEVRQSNAAARHLYEKNGFEAVGVRKKYYREPVEDALLMRLVLPVIR